MSSSGSELVSVIINATDSGGSQASWATVIAASDVEPCGGHVGS